MKIGCLILKVFMVLAILPCVLPPHGFAEDTLLIGIIPEENVFRQVEKHKPLEAYLSGKLGIKVKFTILSKYGDIIDRFTSRKMDGAFFCVFTAVYAMGKLNVEPIARPVTLDGSTSVVGYIIVRKDSGITSVKDMRGKKAAFVDRASATGFIYPLAFLRENGIPNMERYFSEYLLTGSQDSVVYAVMDGRADVGAIKSRVFHHLTAKHPMISDEIAIIAKSMPLPDTTLCLKKNMNPKMKQRLKDVLLNMHNDPDGKGVLKKLEVLKFIESGTADLRPVKRLIEKAGINLRTYRYR